MFGNNKQTNPTTLAQAEDYRQKAEKYSENNQMIDAAIMYGKAYMQFIELGHRTSAKEDYAQAAKMYRAAADIRKKQGNLAEYVEIIEIAENHDLKEKENQDLKEKYTKVLQHHEKITTHQGWGDNSSDQFKEAAKRFNNALNELLETPGGYKHLKGQKSKLSNSLVKMMEKRNTDIQKNPQLEEMLKLLAGLDENAYPKEGGVVDNRIVENRIVEFKNKALACLEHGKLRADKFYEAKNLLDEIKQFTKEASKTSSVLQRITDPKHANKTAFFAAVKKSTSKQDVASIVAHLKIHQAISLDSISLPHNTESTGHRYQRIDSRIFLPKPGNAKNNYSNLSEKELIEVVRKDANRGTLSFEGIPIPAEQGEEFIQQLKQVDRDLRMAFIRSYNQSTVHGHPFDLVATRVASRETHPFLCGFTTADQRMDVSFRQGKVILTVSVQYGETVMGEPVPEAIVKDGTYLIPGEVVATLEISPGQEGFELVSVYATTETARKIYTGNLDDELIRSSDAKQKEYPRTYGFGLTEAERAAADEKNTEHFQNLNKRHEKWKKKQQKEKIALSAEDLKKVSRVEENGEEKKAVAHMKIESSASVENDLSKDAEVSTIDAESAESEEVEGKDEAAVKQEEILESIELGSSKQEVNEKSYLDAALKQVNFYDEKARQASKEKNYDVAAKIYFEAVEDFNKKGETVFAEIMCGRWAEILVEKAAYQTVISEDKNEMMHWCQQGKEACEFGISIYKNEKPHMVAMFQANYWEFVAFELVLNEKYDDAEEAEQRAKGYRIVQFEQTAQEDESAEQYEAAGKNYALAADLCEESGKYDEEAVNLDEKAALYSRIVLFEKEAKEYIAANQNEAAARKYLAAAELYKQAGQADAVAHMQELAKQYGGADFLKTSSQQSAWFNKVTLPSTRLTNDQLREPALVRNVNVLPKRNVEVAANEVKDTQAFERSGQNASNTSSIMRVFGAIAETIAAVPVLIARFTETLGNLFQGKKVQKVSTKIDALTTVTVGGDTRGCADKVAVRTDNPVTSAPSPKAEGKEEMSPQTKHQWNSKSSSSMWAHGESVPGELQLPASAKQIDIDHQNGDSIAVSAY